MKVVNKIVNKIKPVQSSLIAPVQAFDRQLKVLIGIYFMNKHAGNCSSFFSQKLDKQIFIGRGQVNHISGLM